MAQEIITTQIASICFSEASNYLGLAKSKRDANLVAEVFTPPSIAIEVLKKLPDETWNEGKTFIDPECGLGQLIVPVAIIKRELGHAEILSCIFGTDIEQDLVDTCRTRLLDVCGHTTENIALVENNIVCADSFTYNFDF